MPNPRRLHAGLLALVSALVVLALADMFLGEPFRLRALRTEIPCSDLRARPVRVALFSDVDFRGEGRRERRLRELVREFAPHLVFVAGDLIDRDADFAFPERVRSALDFVESLPASHGHYLVPGEEESRQIRTLSKIAESSNVRVLVNEAVGLDIEGERIELFGGDRKRDAPPWTLGREGRRRFVECGARHVDHLLVYDTPRALRWRDVEITLAFQTRRRGARLDLQFGWQPEPTPQGSGWRIVSSRYRPSLRLVAGFRGGHRLDGRVDSGFCPPPRTWCRARIRVRDHGAATRIQARFWPEWAHEPERWSIDATAHGLERRNAGSVALGGRDGRRRYAELRVRDADARILLREDFADPKRLHGSPWRQGARLRAWLDQDHDGVSLLLAHHPDLALDVLGFGLPAPDLTLAGHTHGGQVRLPGIGALFTATRLGAHYDSGLFDVQGLRLFITAGVGTSILPARWFNPPQVALLTLVPASG